jgi:Na+-transporting NADH:ubiquinone oxidoreductase subunit A
MRESTILSLCVLAALPLYGQSGATGDLPAVLLVLIAIVAVLILALVVVAGSSMLRVRARELGVADKANYGLFPSLGEMFGSKVPAWARAQSVIRLKKGFDIHLKGEARKEISDVAVSTFAMQPPNFTGISPIPKVAVEVGSSLKAGEPLFFDKQRPEIHFVAPVSGELVEVRRGPKRAITHLVILADKDQQYASLTPPDPAKVSREELVAFLCSSGFWPFIRQRPFHALADTEKAPRDIFISTFDSAPLAPDNNLIVETDGEAFQRGLDVLFHLTDGAVHLGLNAGATQSPSKVFTEATGVQKHWFKGPHPAGNVGVQIHHVQPILPGETVWTLGVQDVMLLGRIFRDRRFDTTRLVALTGAELKDPHILRTAIGASIGDLCRDRLTGGVEVRCISGDVLTGQAKAEGDFLNLFDDQLTVVREGRDHELFGWLLPLAPRPSASRTFPNFLMPGMRFRAETNTHGEERAFVVTGLYEEVTPMDIYPQHLLKAILANDFERMEGLGIHEVVEEDLALCEFVCPSKVKVQEILREGMHTMMEQG